MGREGSIYSLCHWADWEGEEGRVQCVSLGRLGRGRRKGAACVTGQTGKGKEGRLTARRYESFPLRRKDNNEERKQHSR